jgi:hypothetical protein
MLERVHNNHCSLYSLFTTINIAGAVSLAVVWLVICFPAYGGEREEYEMINITAGQVGILDDLEGPQRYGMEYRFTSFSGPWGFRLIPAIGAAAANNGARFVYSDLRHDFYLSDRWLLIPSFGAGVFKESKEINLGNNLEFRSGLEVAYQFHNKMRAGVAVFHLSNGGISSRNPGTEALVFSFCIPVTND